MQLLGAIFPVYKTRIDSNSCITWLLGGSNKKYLLTQYGMGSEVIRIPGFLVLGLQVALEKTIDFMDFSSNIYKYKYPGSLNSKICNILCKP